MSLSAEFDGVISCAVSDGQSDWSKLMHSVFSNRFLWALSFIVVPNQTLAEDLQWEEAIRRVENRLTEYYDFAHSREDFGAATALNGIDAEKHRCAIIGRMLGFEEEIKEAEYMAIPPLTTEVDAYVQLEYAYSLDSWLAAASWGLEMSPSQRATVWNLECPGKFGIPKDAFFGSGQTKSDFEVGENGTLLVYGDIDVGFYERFLQILEANPQVRVVWLGSGGGSVRDAVLSGIELRRRGLDTQLFASCYSACPFLFAAGASRTIYPSQDNLEVSIGFHQISDAGQAIPIDSRAYEDVSAYFTAMGANGTEIVTWMKLADPNNIYIPPSESLCEAKLATFVYHVCSSPMD